MRIKSSDLRIGRWVRAYFDDVGARDGIIIDKIDTTKEIKIFEPTEDSMMWVEKNRILALGPLVTTPRF